MTAAGGGGPPRVEVATSEAAVFALEGDWTDLWARAPDASPFAHPAWLLPWWRAFGTGQRPRVAALRSPSGALAGLLPMYLLDEVGRGAGPKLLPVGVGVTDHLDALLAPDAPPDAAGRLLAAVLDASPEAAACDLTDLPPGATLRDAPAPPGWRDLGCRDTDPCPVLDLPPGAAGLRDALSPRRWAALRNARNRAARAGGAAVEAATEATWPALLDTLVALHGARWAARGEPGGVLADPAVRAFHADAAPRLLAAGLLRLEVLRLGGVPAAAHHALRSREGRRVFLYLSGFDPARFARESPGALLLAHLVEAALAGGAREVHLLRGGEEYKYLWGARDRRNAARRLLPGRGG